MTSELQSFGAAGTQLRPVPYSHGELGRSITEISRRDVGVRGEWTHNCSVSVCVRTCTCIIYTLLNETIGLTRTTALALSTLVSQKKNAI